LDLIFIESTQRRRPDGVGIATQVVQSLDVQRCQANVRFVPPTLVIGCHLDLRDLLIADNEVPIDAPATGPNSVYFLRCWAVRGLVEGGSLRFRNVDAHLLDV